MSIAIISDLHIKDQLDPSYTLLLNFLKHPLVEQAESLYLLGDIFDFMCGPHAEYFNEFPEFFNLLKTLLLKKKNIYYIEGNHDFHLSLLFKKFLEKYALDKKSFLHTKTGFQKILWGKRYYFSHGDELDLKNYSYQVYKHIIRSTPIHLLINDVVPYSALKLIGQNASQASRKRNNQKKYDFSLLRENYREGAKKIAAQTKAEMIICGHSHIQDDFSLQNQQLTMRYVNNGFAPDTKTFIHIDHHEVEFIHL